MTNDANTQLPEGGPLDGRVRRLVATVWKMKRWLLALFAGGFMLSVDILSYRELNAVDIIYSVIAYVWVYTHPDWKRDA